eukprot:TRINITY_DN10047_c0_g1_i2.p1 TRINITY_DN10047_c0_g1~~TRINITY_DN10047_c0_g1_i2.p1  ORF type:complete len:260 (-),score=50.56 TRINITY_DN10047_c0_g1_i2:204-983(-)
MSRAPGNSCGYSTAPASVMEFLPLSPPGRSRKQHKRRSRQYTGSGGAAAAAAAGRAPSSGSCGSDASLLSGSKGGAAALQWRKFTYPSGTVYEGYMAGDKREGEGAYIDKNGNRYEGQWRNDRAEGHGVKVFAKGDKHEGGYLNDKRSGFGAYFWANGDSYSCSSARVPAGTPPPHIVPPARLLARNRRRRRYGVAATCPRIGVVHGSCAAHPRRCRAYRVWLKHERSICNCRCRRWWSSAAARNDCAAVATLSCRLRA